MREALKDCNLILKTNEDVEDHPPSYMDNEDIILTRRAYLSPSHLVVDYIFNMMSISMQIGDIDKYGVNGAQPSTLVWFAIEMVKHGGQQKAIQENCDKAIALMQEALSLLIEKPIQAQEQKEKI